MLQPTNRTQTVKRGLQPRPLSGQLPQMPNRQISQYRPQQQQAPGQLPQQTGGQQYASGQQQAPTDQVAQQNPAAQIQNGHQAFIQEALKQGYSPNMVMSFLQNKLNLK